MSKRDILHDLKTSIKKKAAANETARHKAQLRKEWKKAAHQEALDYLRPQKKEISAYLKNLSALGVTVTEEENIWGLDPSFDREDKNKRFAAFTFTCSLPDDVKKKMKDKTRDGSDLKIVLLSTYDYKRGGQVDNKELQMIVADPFDYGSPYSEEVGDGYGGTDINFYSYLHATKNPGGKTLSDAVSSWLTEATKRSPLLKKRIVDAPTLPRARLSADGGKPSDGILVRVNRGSAPGRYPPD